MRKRCRVDEIYQAGHSVAQPQLKVRMIIRRNNFLSFCRTIILPFKIFALQQSNGKEGNVFAEAQSEGGFGGKIGGAFYQLAFQFPKDLARSSNIC